MNTAKILNDVMSAVQLKDGLPWEPYSADGRSNTEIVRLYDARDEQNAGPAAAILRYNAGARTKRHIHPGYELIFVLEGILQNDTGAHPAGTLEVCPPDSSHELWSDKGCTFLVVWEQPVKVVEAVLQAA